MKTNKKTIYKELKKTYDSLDAERSVVGGLLLDPCLDRVLGTGLVSDDFSSDKLRYIFNCIVELIDAKKPVDVITARDYIELQEQPKSRSWAVDFKDLAFLTEDCIGTSNIDVYAQHIRTCRIKNDIELLKFNIDYDNYQVTVDEIQKLENELLDKDENSMRNIVSKTIDYIDDVSVNGTGLSSGFESLDALTSGFRQGSLNVVAGRPSMGKSTLALNIANHLSSAKNVLFFSLEMSQVQLMLKIVSSETNLPLHKIERNQLTENEEQFFYEKLAHAGNKSMTIIDKGGLSVKDISSIARKMNVERSVDVILIDYLQIMRYDKGREISELGNITRELKYLSKELQIPVILLSQLSRGVESRENKRPYMSDLRSSGEIEQDADIVMFVYRDEYYHQDTPDRGLAELIVAKNRMGQIGFVKCEFHGDYSKFKDVEIDIYGLSDKGEQVH
jgi:replicative DNA helicase|tara:strand:+ start:459 stop:1799 length:1341 start_codon:yes stop_codon:yes gene_type:complete